jgi:hypothetical protein
MPVQKCKKGGKSGYKYGSQGKCYLGGNKAKQKAHIQGYAIQKSQKRSGKPVT